MTNVREDLDVWTLGILVTIYLCLPACAALEASRYELKTAGFDILETGVEQDHLIPATMTETQLLLMRVLTNRNARKGGVAVLPRDSLQQVCRF